MKKPPANLIGLFILLALNSGCQTDQGMLTDLTSGAGGAALGHQVSGGSLLGSVLGASGGVGASALVKYKFKKEAEDAYRVGYEDGMNQSVKQQYWLIQNRQREGQLANMVQIDWIPVKIEEQEINGERIKERIEYIPVGRT